jgi:hypothetical protein
MDEIAIKLYLKNLFQNFQLSVRPTFYSFLSADCWRLCVSGKSKSRKNLSSMKVDLSCRGRTYGLGLLEYLKFLVCFCSVLKKEATYSSKYWYISIKIRCRISDVI